MGRSVAEVRRLEALQDKPALQMERLRPLRILIVHAMTESMCGRSTDTEELTGEAVEEAAGAFELGEEFFFGAEFAGMGDKRTAGAARGMFDVKHFVIEDIFDDELRDERMIHAAIEKDLIGAGIVATELAAPGASAPTEMGAGKRATEKFLVERFEYRREVEVETLR